MSSEAKGPSLWREAQQHLVGGVNSPVRAYSAVHGDPRFVARAEGAMVHSVDGEQFVDFVNSFGPLILGHANEAVVEAVCEAARLGTSFAAPHEGEVRLALEIKRRIPQIKKVRLVNSGTEAVQSAVRLARGFTGRDRIVKFDGCYHGHVDSLLVKAGSGLATFGIASSAGVTEATAAETDVLPLEDEEAVEALFKQKGDSIAAVIIEPLPANYGLLPQRREFLELLRRLCDQAGCLLIFDEVITGLRTPSGSIGNEIDVQPDLYTLGKVIGGGLPVGAYGGRVEVMDQLAPLGPVYQAGTLSGNPLAVAAGLATLAEMDRSDVLTVLERLGGVLEDQVVPVLERSEHPFSLVRRHSLFWLAYGEDKEPRSIDKFHPNAGPVFADLHRELLKRGFMLAPSAFEVGFLSLAHTDQHLMDFAQALEAGLAEIEPR